MENVVTILRDNKNSLKLLYVECSKRHTQCKYLMGFEFFILNINLQNYVSELNDKIYVVKRCGEPPASAKSPKSVRRLKKSLSLKRIIIIQEIM